MNRLLWAVVLAVSPCALSSGQTIQTPQTQSGQGSVNVGNAGQGSGNSVNGDVGKTGSANLQLKGSIDGYQAPSIDLDAGAAADVGPAFSPGVGSAELGGPGSAVAPETVERTQSQAVPEVQGRTLPLKHAAPITEGLEETVTDIRKAGKDGGAASPIAIESSLNKIFEGARQAARKTADSADFGSVIGAMLKVETKIRRTVSVANTSSPHDAPGLYNSAVEMARESLPASTADAVRRTVMTSADRKAETALPALANEAVSQAARGSSKGVTAALKSFDDWESLLGKPGRPLVENLSHLKSFVRNMLGNGAGPAHGAGPETGAGTSASPQARDEGKTSASGASLAPALVRDRVWFRRDVQTRSFLAVLPGSAVSPVPALALSFGLPSVQASFGFGEDAFASFLARPTAGAGFGLVYRTLREAGLGRARSFMAAASYWVKTVLARAISVLKSLARRSVSAEKAALLAADEAGEYAAAQNLLSRQDGAVSLAAAQELLRRAGRMAALYDELSGDSGGIGAVRDISGRLAETGSSEPGFLSPAAGRLIMGGDGGSLAYWIERIHGAMAGGAAALGAPGPTGSGAWEGLSPSAFDGGAGAGKAALERLLSDVETRRDAAVGAASVLASLDPSPARYTDLGRVGGLLAQGMTVRLRDGRTIVLTLLRDAELGRIAFARAETAGSSRSLSVRELSSGLRVD